MLLDFFICNIYINIANNIKSLVRQFRQTSVKQTLPYQNLNKNSPPFGPKYKPPEFNQVDLQNHKQPTFNETPAYPTLELKEYLESQITNLNRSTKKVLLNKLKKDLQQNVEIYLDHHLEKPIIITDLNQEIIKKIEVGVVQRLLKK